jgi:dihydroorotate dehydrogenase electron transfer subunit
MEFLFATVGQGTGWLADRATDDSLDILGPLGNGFEIHPDARNLLLVAGGIGIAPMVYLAEKAVADGLSVKLILGAATASQLYPEAINGAEFIRITDDGSAGEKGLVTDLLPSLAKWADQIFACGPIPMYRTMAGMIDEFEGKSVKILLEQVMACGVGACRGCAVPTGQGMKMVCQDGPVFDLRGIRWEEMAVPRAADFKEQG